MSTAASEKKSQDKPNHETTIIVNGQEKTTTEKELTFEEVVSIAYDGNPPTGPNWEFTVTYRRGQKDKPEGSLVAGGSVKVKEGMIFNVRATDKS
jgi:Multiubiquitin